MGETILLLILVGAFIWFCDLCSGAHRKRCEKKCLRCSLNKDVVPPPNFKISKPEYTKALQKLRKEISFESALGLTNPYTEKKVKTKEDYELYLHCFVLKEKSEAFTKELERQWSEELHSYKMDLSVLQSNEARLKNVCRRRGVFSLICIAFLVCCLVLSFFLPSRADLNEQISSLTKERNILSAQLSELNVNITSASTSNSGQWKSKYFQEKYGQQTTISSDFPNYDDTLSVTTNYVGNSSSKVFHRFSCSSLPDVKNQVAFSTRNNAINSGYRACEKCSP